DHRPGSAAPGSGAPRYRDAAHGRLRVPLNGSRAAQACPPADRDAHLARGSEASREGEVARCDGLHGQAVPGGRTHPHHRAARDGIAAARSTEGGIVINVAIADDSPFTCKLLASYVEDGGECKVVGLAHDAQSTIELIRRETPDVLTLDLQMPGGDGLDLLRQLADKPPVSVVVISGVTRLAAATTLKALELGAVDFILKYTPDAPVSRASLRREIIAKVKAAAAAHPTRRTAPAVPAAGVPPSHLPARAASRVPAPSDAAGVVIIGASTGGPSAIGEL